MELIFADSAAPEGAVEMLLQIKPRSRANPVAIFGNRSKALVRCQEIFCVAGIEQESEETGEHERGTKGR